MNVRLLLSVGTLRVIAGLRVGRASSSLVTFTTLEHVLEIVHHLVFFELVLVSLVSGGVDRHSSSTVVYHDVILTVDTGELLGWLTEAADSDLHLAAVTHVASSSGVVVGGVRAEDASV